MLDPYVWGSVQAYYHNNRAHGAVREEWDFKGLYVNWWEAEPLVLQMPWGLKTMWHGESMPSRGGRFSLSLSLSLSVVCVHVPWVLVHQM